MSVDELAEPTVMISLRRPLMLLCGLQWAALKDL